MDVWQHVLQQIHTAYSTVLGHLKPGAKSPLQFALAGDGSLLLSSRVRDATPLFDAPELPLEVAVQALRIIVEASQ